MKTSQAGIDFIKSFEGCELEPYVCSAGKKTIGVGHVMRRDEAYERITPAQADAILAKDLERFEEAVLDAVDVPLSQYEFDACISLAFNIGAHAFANSTLVRLLNHNTDKPTCAEQFLRWDKVNGKPLAGLTRRRAAERELFLGQA